MIDQMHALPLRVVARLRAIRNRAVLEEKLR